jgi:hypothetical protein
MDGIPDALPDNLHSQLSESKLHISALVKLY